MAGPSSTVDQNLLPVQAYFDVYGNFQTFIGQGQPFYATLNPIQSGLTITNSTINSTIIGATSPSTGVFTNVSATTGQISTSPTNATDIANKFYVDTVAQGLGPKAACAVATTANITLSGLQTIDGYTTLAGDRVLVKNEASSQFNGIYIASAGTWTRATDMDVWAEVPGAYTVVLNGGQADTGWVCTASQTGTINVTAMPWVQFSGINTYYAGTGLTLASNTFSITPVGTAGTYGSASAVPVFVTNASGQVTSVTNTSIAINANQITSGAIASSLISGSYTGITGVGTLTAGTWNATPIANSYLANSSITINGNAVSLGGSTTVTANTPNSLTFNNSGAGGASGTTFNGSVAQTISYNTIGAPSTTGTNASGTWGISISGNAATVTNGVYTTGAYSNPSWITSILGSIVSGAVANATLAASATNVAGGTTGSLVYQTGAGATSFLGLGTTNYVLTAGVTAPQYVAQSTLSVGSASTATTSTNLAGGVAGAIPWQSAPSTTGFTAAGTTGQVLTSAGTGTPIWTTPTSYATVTDDTTTNSTRYPLFANQTSGNLSTEYTSSTKLQYNPNTGVFTATGFSGSGASLTNLTAGNLSGTIPSGVLGNSSLYIGTTAVPLNSASGSITSLAVNISGSASSATTATTATNATNIAITDNTSSSSTYYPVLSLNSSGNNPATTSSTQLSFVPSTGALTATALNSSGGALNGSIGATTANTGKFTTLESTGTASLGDASTTYIQVIGDASYPGIYATGGTNTPLVLQPLGTGALQAQKTTSSATGGNARGANAVDWQTLRTAAGQVASNAQSVIVGGQNNTASGNTSFVGGGYGNIASGYLSSIVGGQTNTASNAFTTISNGHLNTAAGYLNFIGAGESNSGTASATVTTQTTTIAVTAATTLYLSSANANIKVGQLIQGTGVTTATASLPYTYATSTVTTGTPAVMNTSTISGTTLTVGSLASGTIIAGMVLTGTGVTAGTYIVSGSGSTWTVSTSQSVSSTTITGTAYTFTISQAATTAAGVTLSFYTPHGVVVGGGNNQATGAYSFIGGGGDAGTAANRNTASGDFSVVCGGRNNTASNLGSFVGGGGIFTGTSTYPNTASGISSAVVGGIYNTASGSGSFVGAGYKHLADAAYSTVLGGAQGTTRGIVANTVFCASNSPITGSQGVSQSALLVLGRQTTDATATVLTSDVNAASGTNQVILPNNSAYYFKVRVIAGVTGGGNTKAWTLEGAIKRGAGVGTTAIVGTVTTTVVAADAGAATWTVTATADTTNGGLAITVTGQAATTIRWVAKAETAEMTF